MQYLSDLLLTAAALGAAAYCVVLSRRLKALGSLEGGMGSAIAVLSSQVDDLSRSLKSAQEAAGRTGGRLDGQTARAEAVARKLELLVASMHDIEDPAAADPLPAQATFRAAAAARSPAPAPRPPSPWPGGGLRRAQPVPDGDPVEAEGEHEPAQRARILRRRQTPGVQ